MAHPRWSPLPKMCQRIPKEGDGSNSDDEAEQRAQDERLRQLREERARLAREDAEMERRAREAAAESERLRVLLARQQAEN